MERRGRFPKEVRERSVRLVFEQQEQHESQWAAICSISGKMGCSPQTLHKWVGQAEKDAGKRPGLTTSERERVRADVSLSDRLSEIVGGPLIVSSNGNAMDVPISEGIECFCTAGSSGLLYQLQSLSQGSLVGPWLGGQPSDKTQNRTYWLTFSHIIKSFRFISGFNGYVALVSNCKNLIFSKKTVIICILRVRPIAEKANSETTGEGDDQVIPGCVHSHLRNHVTNKSLETLFHLKRVGRIIIGSADYRVFVFEPPCTCNVEAQLAFIVALFLSQVRIH